MGTVVSKLPANELICSRASWAEAPADASPRTAITPTGTLTQAPARFAPFLIAITFLPCSETLLHRGLRDMSAVETSIAQRAAPVFGMRRSAQLPLPCIVP